MPPKPQSKKGDKVKKSTDAEQVDESHTLSEGDTQEQQMSLNSTGGVSTVQNNESMTFVFELWCKEAELSPKVIDILVKEELMTSKALCLISNEDISKLGLSMGQEKLLAKAVRDLSEATTQSNTASNSVQVAGTSGMVSTNDVPGAPESLQLPQSKETTSEFNLADLRQQTQDLFTAGKTFNDIMNTQGGQPMHPSPKAHQAQTNYQFDPRHILTLKANRIKALHITDFLTENTKKRRQSRRK